MASQFRNYSTSAILRTTRELGGKYPFVAVAVEPPDASYSSKTRAVTSWRIRVSDGGDSYMDMWKKAVVRDRNSTEFERLVGNSAGVGENGGKEEEEAEEDHESPEVLERKSNEFFRILEVSPEERDRVQRMQVIDRAAAAIAAARSLLLENVPPPKLDSNYPSSTENLGVVNGTIKTGNQREGN